MIAWRKRQILREQQRAEFAKVIIPVFLKLYVDKTYGIKGSDKEIKEARQAMCEGAWNVADDMLKARSA